MTFMLLIAAVLLGLRLLYDFTYLKTRTLRKVSSYKVHKAQWGG